MPAPFHLAIPVDDIAEARRFYGELLGCPEGRSAEDWVDFDFFGHQLVTHQVAEAGALGGGHRPRPADASNPVDGHDVPVPHFGVVLAWDDWQVLSERLKGAGLTFVIEPYVRFRGQVGEQATLFFRDPFGNALEFKSFRDPDQLFAR